MKPILPLVVIILTLAGCAKPPAEYDYKNTRTYNKGYDAVWSGLVKYFALNNISVNAIEKESGLLSAESGQVPESYADCGYEFGYRIQSRTGKLNGLVEKITETQTKLTINTSYDSFGVIMNGNRYSTSCNSTGKVETEILDYISNDNSTVTATETTN